MKLTGTIVGTLFGAVLLFTTASPAVAGCGCQKPPPAVAAVRPHFAYAAEDVGATCDLRKGGCVALFDDGLVAGNEYDVTFAPLEGPIAAVSVVAQERRDLADGSDRPQLWVPVPDLPLGPTEISVATAVDHEHAHDGTLFSIPAADFTVIAEPVRIPAGGGFVAAPRYRAAVGADGAVYIAVDITGIVHPASFVAQGFWLGLRYEKDNMLIYNAQGFLMEILSSTVRDEDLNNDGDWNDPGEGDWNGNGRLDNPDVAEVVHSRLFFTSDGFVYDRHGFEAYEAKHNDGGQYALDPDDPNWHANGTPHIDHHHLVVVIDAATLNGRTLTPGATHPFLLGFDTVVQEPESPTPPSATDGNAPAAGSEGARHATSSKKGHGHKRPKAGMRNHGHRHPKKHK